MAASPPPSGAVGAPAMPAPRVPAPAAPPAAALEALDEAHPGKVPVSVLGAHAYVWRVQDASRLRVEHHICGMLIGTLPLIPQQNVFLGLPLQLIPEEVVYLLRAHAIVLIDDPAAFRPPSRTDVDHYIAALNADAARQAAEQAAASKTSRTAAIQKLLQSGADPADLASAPAAAATGPGPAEDSAALQKAVAKRKAREEKRARERQLAAQAPSQADDAAGDRKDVPQDASAAASNAASPAPSPPSFPPPASQVQARERDPAPATDAIGRDEWGQLALPNAYQYTTPAAALQPPLPMEWYQPVPAQPEGARGNVYTSLSSAKQAGLWLYPRTAVERARCAVFESLHALGYYMGVGLRFGGDFVVYPGDPLRYHSHFTATVKASPSAPMSAMELIANGRLGTAVKKAHLIAACDGIRHHDHGHETDAADLPLPELEREDSIDTPFGSVEYFSLTWAGFGT